MSIDKSMLNHLRAMPRKELVDYVVYLHDDWLLTGRSYNKLKAKNDRLVKAVKEIRDYATGDVVPCNDCGFSVVGCTNRSEKRARCACAAIVYRANEVLEGTVEE